MTKLSEKARLAKNAYQKMWKEKNPDKVRQHAINYWNKKAEDMESSLDRAIAYNDRDDKETINPVSVPNKTVKTTEPGQAICINCGDFFKPKRTTAKYCRDLCRKQYNRLNK